MQVASLATTLTVKGKEELLGLSHSGQAHTGICLYASLHGGSQDSMLIHGKLHVALDGPNRTRKHVCTEGIVFNKTTGHTGTIRCIHL